MRTIDDAVRHMRARPEFEALVRDAYLGADVRESARRFEASGEFAEVRRLTEAAVAGGAVVDLGAGTGIASRAFARLGARIVYAIEPDPSDEVGQGAIRRLTDDLPIEIISSFGESLPLADGSIDVIYARQVLHHTRDLDQTLRECARVLKPGGMFLACREHVVDGPDTLRAFLAAHPMHQLAGGENAYTLAAYVGAVRSAGLALEQLLGPWDSVINAFPIVRTQDELRQMPGRLLERKLGYLGRLVSALPGVAMLVWARIRRPVPGRMYTFLARKR